jgi:hypothetical protein
MQSLEQPVMFRNGCASYGIIVAYHEFGYNDHLNWSHKAFFSVIGNWNPIDN